VVIVAKALNGASPLEAFQISQDDLATLAIVENFPKFVLRVYEQEIEGVSELRFKQSACNRIGDTVGRATIGILSTCGFQD
jgi:hypothetical protein